jgi:spermidine synthase
MIPALGLAFLSGYIALSYEILWYRALSFMSEGDARTFGLMLGAYLAGLALGALAVRRACEQAAPTLLRILFRLTVGANLLGFFVVPALAWLATRDYSPNPWRYGLWGVGLAAAGLGAIFPLVAHAWIKPDEEAGRQVSHLYLANILGSTAGSLVTGFILMDHLSLGALHVLLGFLGLGMAALLLALDRGSARLGAAASIVVIALANAVFGMKPFDAVYEKLQLKAAYRPETRFAHVVETRSGVITVNTQGQIFGGGIYDGAFNTSLDDDKNAILRCYALAGLHRAPKEALMIGLSSGSWATVIANHPGLERLTIIEINPGYLRLIPGYPDVAGLLGNPKVRIEIDDGRRWLLRNRDRNFDLIVANATFHWRSNATNLLSKEFLELVRARLKPGGIYYYNTTGSARVQWTGASTFPHALKIMNFLALSDTPVELDLERLKEELVRYPRGTGFVLDAADPAGRRKAEERIRGLAPQIETREQLLARLGNGLRGVTDDNMGTEWEERR